MKTLRLAVKREYFEAIKRGEKLEEYREIKPYWTDRFLRECILDKDVLRNVSYDEIIITCGYPKKTDKDKFLRFKWIGFKAKEITHKHFGDQPILVYAIDLSERINNDSK